MKKSILLSFMLVSLGAFANEPTKPAETAPATEVHDEHVAKMEKGAMKHHKKNPHKKNEGAEKTEVQPTK